MHGNKSGHLATVDLCCALVAQHVADPQAVSMRATVQQPWLQAGAIGHNESSGEEARLLPASMGTWRAICDVGM